AGDRFSSGRSLIRNRCVVRLSPMSEGRRRLWPADDANCLAAVVIEMRPYSYTRRVAQLTSVVVRHGLAHAGSGRLPRWVTDRLPSPGLPGPERLRAVFEEMGGTFIKFGQMLALQPDLVSLEYCNALFKLLDQVTPFGIEQVRQTFVEELGKPPGDIFDSFDE